MGPIALPVRLAHGPFVYKINAYSPSRGPMSPQLLRSVTVLFFLSGAIALVYEVIWGKYLGATLGHTGLAHAVVLATFMGGLAIGNALLGRLADRAKSQLSLYGWLELGVGALAALSPALLGGLSHLYVHLATTFGLTGGALLAAKALVAALALLPPTILMGGTLPALSRFTTRSLATMQSSIGRLYFLNSFGAVAGSLVAGFVWIPAYGLERALFLGAAINIGVGLMAIYLSKRVAEPAPEGEAPAEAGAPTYGARQVRAMLIAVTLSGFVSLAYEVAWIRLLSLVLGSSTYSFSLMLAAFVGGIALGSWLVHRARLPGSDPYVQFGWAQWGIALSVMLTLPFYEQLPLAMMRLGAGVPRVEAMFYLFEAVKFGVCFLLMLAPATCIGMTLPLASRVVTRSVSEVGAKVGTVFSLNTMGNVAGALVGGLVLMPAFGIRGAIEVGLVINLLLAGLLVLAAPQGARGRRWALAGAPLAVLAVYHAVVPGWDMRLLTIGAYRQNVAAYMAQGGDLKQMLAPFKNIYHRDDPGATIDVVQTPDEVVMYTNGKADASSKGDMATQRLLGQLPLLIRPQAEEVLLVGLGSGVTAGSVLTHPVKSLDVVEIAPAVLEASEHFAHVNHRPLTDARTRVHIDDASSHLRLSPQRYDVVISEPSNPWVAGIGNLFTTEFYREVSHRLKPGGLMVQWFHTYEMDDPTFRLVLRTFTHTFGHVALWQPEHGDVILVGSHAPIRLQADAAIARLAVPRVAEDLAPIRLTRLSTLLSLQMITDEGVRRLAGPGPLNTEAHPILEYQAPKAFFTGARSYLHFGADERLRVGHHAPDLLWMPQYLAQRGHGLTAEELSEIVDHNTLWFPEVATSHVRRVFLEAWIAQAPRDARPKLQLIQWLRDRQRTDEARALVESLLAERPQDVALLDMALDLEFGSLHQRASYLKRDGAAFRRMAERAARLRALQPQAEDGLDRRLAAIAFETGHLHEGYASIDRSARRAAGAERQALWLVAAQAAFDGRDYPVAVRYVKQILAEDGHHPGALQLGETLARKLKARS